MGNRLGLILAILGLLGTAACQKDRPAADGDGDIALTGASRPSAGNDAALPVASWSADTEGIVAIDLAQFRDSPVGPLVDNLLGTSIRASAKCRASVLDAATQLLVVSVSTDTGDPIYVFRGVTPDHAAGCGDEPTVWLDKTTVAIAPGWELDALRAATASSQRTNPRVLAAITHVDTNAALWFAAAPAGDDSALAGEFSELRGAIALDKGFRAVVDIKMQDADKAATAAAEFERTLPMMMPFAKHFEHAGARAEGPWLHARIIMSRDQLASFAADPVFASLFPAPQ